MTFLGIFLDLVLIGLLGLAISYAIKLTRQLNGLQAHRAEMERFVAGFSASILRAEASIQALKLAARSSGDDLEQLIEKGQNLRDELMLLNGSADQIASRLSQAATLVAKAGGDRARAMQDKPVPASKAASVSPLVPESKKPLSKAASAAERELMQALEKIG